MRFSLKRQRDDFSALQDLIKLTHSTNPQDKHKAAASISRLCEAQSFPASSFGPLSHALCRLLPSNNRATASYAARAVKLLLLDDTLRPLVATSTLPNVLVAMIQKWSEDVPCLREVLGALQTLCWEAATARVAVNAGCVQPLCELLSAADAEIRTLAMATSANLLSFSDTVFLTDEDCINTFFDVMEDILEAVRTPDSQSLRLYATAAVANAAAHPVLCSRLMELGAAKLMRETELDASAHVSLTLLALGGLGVAECSQSALVRLTFRESGGMYSNAHGDIESGTPSGNVAKKYVFKWGSGGSIADFYASRAQQLKIAACSSWVLSMLLLIRLWAFQRDW